MIDLKTVGDYIVLVLVAGAGGAFGGLAAALVPTASPGVNTPRWLTGPIVGAAAGVAILLVLPGTKDTTSVKAGMAVTTTTWSLLKVVPVALIAGWAGPKALGILNDRLVAAVSDAKLAATANVAQVAVQNVANSAQAAIGEHPDQTAATAVGPALNAAVVRSAQHAADVITAAAA